MIEHDHSHSAPATAEEARLEEIAALRLTAPDAGEGLQEFAERAATRLGTEVGLVTIVLDQAQYFLGAHGLTGWMAEARGMPLEWSLCAHAVKSRMPFIVEDTEDNALVREYPVVVEDGLRSYAGVPLLTSRGYAVGTVCVCGASARDFSPGDMAVLESLADEVVKVIESRREVT